MAIIKVGATLATNGDRSMTTLYLPELLYCGEGRFRSGVGLLVGADGKIVKTAEISQVSECKVVNLPGRALLPAFVNAHSHSFQRLIRGKAESRTAAGKNFWSWRETMYHAAAHLDPDEIYDVARMAFLEMALAGAATVGEFHYLHRAPDGCPYDDPNLLAKKVIEAAHSVGLRIVLLRTAYRRAGYEVAPNPGQTRFIESTREFLANVASLLQDFPTGSDRIHFGVAPHSIRAVPLEDLGEIIEWSRHRKLPVHMHVAEQRAEVTACEREYGLSPVTLFEREKLLGPDFTAVHAIHISAEEMDRFAESGATICSCPTTERNLGDGVLPADQAALRGIRIALGSDSQAQIDPLEDARQMDYHLRLTHEQRAILDQIGGQELARRLFECATVNGAKAMMIPGGNLDPGSPADFFTVDLSDPSIAGNSPNDLLSLIVFSLNRTAICDVAVLGKFIVRDRVHSEQREIVSRYEKVFQRVWPQ
jgi:formimidoylglutamate deiminase